MQAATNGNLIKLTGLDESKELSLHLGEAFKASDARTISIDRFEVFYQDQRTIKPESKPWQNFLKAFTTSLGWSTGAAVISAIGILFFNIIKSKRETS